VRLQLARQRLILRQQQVTRHLVQQFLRVRRLQRASDLKRRYTVQPGELRVQSVETITDQTV
jgi:hypothetical protein